MKKQLILAFALLAGIFIVSCNEDDDPEFKRVDRMAGTWKLSQIGSLNAGNALHYVAAGDCTQTLIFADSTFTENNGMLVDGACQTETETGLYGIDQGNLIRYYNDATESTVDILNLSDVQLELVQTNDAGVLTFLRYARQTPIVPEEE